MDIKILLLICYNAVSISESSYLLPESVEQSVMSQLQRNRRSSPYIGNAEPDQCFCFSSHSVSLSLEEQLDPDSNGLQRLVVYLYYNVHSDQSYFYIPNHAKQSRFPSLNFEQNDVLQLLPDKGFLENNTNSAILINNLSPKQVNGRAVKPADKPFQNEINENSYLHNHKFSKRDWKDNKSVKTNEPLSDFPSEYYDLEYETPPLFQEIMKIEKPPLTPVIGFNQVPYVISKDPKSRLNLSHIVPDKSNIVHFTRTNHAAKSILQPCSLPDNNNLCGFLLPDNSGKNILHKKLKDSPNHSSSNMNPNNFKVYPNWIRVPPNYPNSYINYDISGVDTDTDSVPPTRPQSSTKLDNSAVDPYMIKVPLNHLSSYINLGNLDVDPNMITVPLNHPNSYIIADISGVGPKIIRVPPNHSQFNTIPDNSAVDPKIINVPLNHLNSYINPDNLEVDPNMIRFFPNHPHSNLNLDNSAVDPKMTKVPTNHPNSYIKADISGVIPKIIRVPPNHSQSNTKPDNSAVDPKMTKVPSNHINSYINPENLEVDPNIIRVLPNHPNSYIKADISGVDTNTNSARRDLPQSYIKPNKSRVNPNMMKVSPNHQTSHKSTDNLDFPTNHSDPEQSPNNFGAMIKQQSEQRPDKQSFKPNKMNKSTNGLLRNNNMFSDWYSNQIADANHRMVIQSNNDTLKQNILRSLARYSMYVTQDGYLTNELGTIINWDYLQLRAILVGEPVEYETVINSPDSLHFESNSTYSKALLITFGPSMSTTILDIIPLGKVHLLEKSELKNHSTIRDGYHQPYICKSKDCKEIVPVQVDDESILSTMQNYMEMQAQQPDIEPKQYPVPKKFGLQLNHPKSLISQINNKYRKGNITKRKKMVLKSGRGWRDPVDRKSATSYRRGSKNKTFTNMGIHRNVFTKSGHRRKGHFRKHPKTTGVSGTKKAIKVPNTVGENDWRIIGGAAATSSGAPISVRGRSGFIP